MLAGRIQKPGVGIHFSVYFIGDRFCSIPKNSRNSQNESIVRAVLPKLN
jgi:hypothetical protein